MTNLKFIPVDGYIEIVDTVDNLAVGEIWLGDPLEVMLYERFTFVTDELIEIAEYMKGIRK